METPDQAASRTDMRLDPISQFAIKTFTALAIIVSAWILLGVGLKT